MSTPDINAFFDHPILNSPYKEPTKHWELDSDGQPTQRILNYRRQADFITPIPTPKNRKVKQLSLIEDEVAASISSSKQDYHKSLINEIRNAVKRWRELPENQWHVTPETARLLTHWRTHQFSGIRPFFCQVEAVETAIWLTEVAPQIKQAQDKYIKYLYECNEAEPYCREGHSLSFL